MFAHAIYAWFHVQSASRPVYWDMYARLTALFPGLPGWAGTRKVKPIWILLKQETVSGCGISWAICKSAPCSRLITMPAPHRSVFYRPDALSAAQPTASKRWNTYSNLLSDHWSLLTEVWKKSTGNIAYLVRFSFCREILNFSFHRQLKRT